jgi:hypothetical protein
MRIDVSDIQADVYHKNDKGTYYVKLSFPSIGMYINSITVRPSSKNPNGMWVQMPAMKLGRWIHVIEFKSDSQLQVLFHDAALRAVDVYNHESILPDVELENIDEELGRQIDKWFPEKPQPP